MHSPEGHYIDELADFLEWIANAKPEDEEIHAEINRYYYAVGDINGGISLSRCSQGGQSRHYLR